MKPLAHLAFFEALGRLETDSAEWRATSAGLVALRLVDQAAEDDIDLGEIELASVEDAIAAIDEGDTRRGLLQSIIDALHNQSDAAIPPRLLAYGRSLQLRASWPLAIDVYESVLSHPAIVDQPDLAISASFQRGYCLRVSGDLDAAERSYQDARRLAEETGDRSGVLRAEVARANLAQHRGNLPRAEELLASVITRAEQALVEGTMDSGLRDVMARALQDRMQVAARRGNLESAVVYGRRALDYATGPTLRDRTLADIATTLAALGERQAAREAHLVIAATAQEQFIRWVSTINLLEIAALDGRESAFDRYRRELADEALPPNLGAYYHLYAGEGCRQFGQYGSARDELSRALAIAQEGELNEVVIRAEVALRELDAVRPAERRPSSPPSPAVAEVVEAITSLRKEAGVALD